MVSLEKANKIAKILSDKKGKNILLIDINEVTTLGDYFVVVSADSAPHLKALADEVEEKMLEAGVHHNHIEGYNNPNWILMDYGDVIVQIFHSETREFYDIERLWPDAKVIEYKDEDENN